MATSRQLSEIAEGTYHINSSLRAAYNSSSSNEINLFHVFQRFIVVDVFVDPVVITEEKLLSLQQKYGEIKNAEHGEGVPRNSILAKKVADYSKGNSSESTGLMILYPFFPSHIALPCKPGEHVWVMFESLTNKKSLGYWICRIVGPQHIDDVNYSHAPREYDGSFRVSQNSVETMKEVGVSVTPRYHFKNGVYTTMLDNNGNATTYVDPQSYYYLSDVSPESAYEMLLSGSDASRIEVREPVPRFKKRPGDLALEGSNNTLIVLGRDRLETFGVGNSIFDGKFSQFSSAGSIDMVAGRGSGDRSSTEGTASNSTGTSGNLVVNDIGEVEVDKYIGNLISSEGDPDVKNDRSRILISQRTSPDQMLGIDRIYNSPLMKVDDSVSGDAAVVIKTDKVRIVARSDVQFLVTGYDTAQDALGNVVKDESSDINTFASITIKSNGDIVFKPSKEGYIKLGGDDANRGIVCSELPVTPTGGGVVGPPLITTMGGQFAGSKSANSAGNLGAIGSALGTYANKVLIK